MIIPHTSFIFLRMCVGLCLFSSLSNSQSIYYPLETGNKWIYQSIVPSFWQDTLSIDRDSVMSNGKSYAVIRHRRGGLRATAWDTVSYQRQEGAIVYQYFPAPYFLGAEYPIYNFSLSPNNYVSQIPYSYYLGDSMYVDTMGVGYWKQEMDSVFDLGVTGWYFWFDPNALAIDDEFLDVVVDSFGVVRSEYNITTMVLIGAIINGNAYGSLTSISDVPIRPLPLQSHILNYPDPFNISTTIKFNLNRSLSTAIRIYNTLGQQVFEDILGPISPGPHNYDFRANNLPSGVYYYRVETDLEIQTGRMLLMK